MAKKRTKSVAYESPITALVNTDESIPSYSGSTNTYEVEPRLQGNDLTIVGAVESIPFVGRAISDLFFGETKRNEKLDQLAAQKVTVLRQELDRVSPRAAYDLGNEFYDNAYARERNVIANVR